MKEDILEKHIQHYFEESKRNPEKFSEDFHERENLISYYQRYSKDEILKMNEDDIYEYLSKLWAMIIWGNKHYVIDKIIQVAGLENFRQNIADLVWGKNDIINRWDNFRKQIKGMGPAMISEILCKTHPNDYMLMNYRLRIHLAIFS